MAKPVSFVRLDIARFGVEVADRARDSDLAKWVRSLYRSLALGDKTLNEYGATLLNEAESFAVNVSERQREKALKRWEKATPDATASHGIATASHGNAGNATSIQASKHTSIQAKKNTEDGSARSRFTRPTLEQVAAYCFERKNSIDPQKFFDHYEANGWVQGKNKPIKNWQAAIRTWEGRDFQTRNASRSAASNRQPGTLTRKGEHDENLAL